jgi:hypothetical protein
VDSLVVALKTLGVTGPFIAMNPWVAVAMWLMGRSPVAVVGVYAAPGSSSFRILRWVLRETLVVTTSPVEAREWRKAGGRAEEVRYGNTFEYPRKLKRATGAGIRIFVGGMSDRDVTLVSRLEDEIKHDVEGVSLTVVMRESASRWVGKCSSIVHTGEVGPSEFGRLISQSDVVFLPLRSEGRASGHMVAVGALESGVPVVSVDVPGMEGYFDGFAIRALDPAAPLLGVLVEVAQEMERRSGELREIWERQYSQHAFVARVCEVLERESWTQG